MKDKLSCGCNLKWDEINDIIHDAKNALTLIAGVEYDLKKVRKKIGMQIDELYKMIDRAVNGRK